MYSISTQLGSRYIESSFRNKMDARWDVACKIYLFFINIYDYETNIIKSALLLKWTD